MTGYIRLVWVHLGFFNNWFSNPKNLDSLEYRRAAHGSPLAEMKKVRTEKLIVGEQGKGINRR